MQASPAQRRALAPAIVVSIIACAWGLQLGVARAHGVEAEETDDSSQTYSGTQRVPNSRDAKGNPSAVPGSGAAVTGPVNLGDITGGDPYFYTSNQSIADTDGQKVLLGTGRPNRTHSQVPHLPVYMGYMNTNATYRFVSVAEQVFTMIGEGKHGLWRVAENGMIREYRRKGASGLPLGADLAAPANLRALRNDYEAWLPEDRFAGYRYPDDPVGEDGQLNFVDLPITHAKYDGKYARHEPIDLPGFYCTMSGPDYPYARKAMDFAFSQGAAKRVGPLGRRAGLDVDENYTRVLQLEQFPDARSWVNTGVPGKDASWVRWQAIDAARTKAEYYLVERPFFNVPYLFVFAVYDNTDNDDFRYLRPDGPYYEAIKERAAKIPAKVTDAPRFHVEGAGLEKAVGLPVFGVHHPDRAAFGGGGACPLKGGDYGRYPKTDGGAGWPTQYEEVTPLCDAVLVDIKFWGNLDARDWNDPAKYLANAGARSSSVHYTVQPGRYGTFSDPYNTARAAKNPDEAEVPEHLTLHFPAVAPAVAAAAVVPSRGPEPLMQPTAATSCRPVQAAQQ